MNPELTKSERKVYLLCCQGLTNLEISKGLNISINTVKTHMRAIFKKKKVKNRTALVLLSIQEKNEGLAKKTETYID